MLHKEHHGPDYLYRTGVGIVLINQEKKIFAAKRIKSRSNSWQMPQGGMDYGEHEDETAVRELHEETGVKSAKIITKTEDYHYYNFPYILQKKFWGGKYMGQKQRWYLMQFEGHENEIRLDQFEYPEFSEYKWTTQDFILDNVVQFKKKIYENVIHEFGGHLR